MNTLDIIVYAILGLAVLYFFVRAFGAEKAWTGVKAVWTRLTSGGNVIAPLALVGMLGACAVFPNTTAAYNSGGVSAAVDEFFVQTNQRVVAICSLAQDERISAMIDIGGAVAGQSELVADTREDRETWCAALGGTLTLDIQ